MMKQLLALTFLFSSLTAADVSVQNRVLAKVNGKAITVMDVTRKMDLYLLKANPDAFSKPEMRYQFYRGSWRDMLLDMVDRELVLKEAQERGMPVSSGDVREELEHLFGPNVLMNLEKAGLTYEEASEMIKSEITIRRMLAWRVSSRVENAITPEEVRKAYDEYVKEGIHREEYSYRMLTVRSDQLDQARDTAKEAYRLLSEEKIALDEVGKRLSSDKIHVTISETFIQKKQEIAPHIEASLKPLQAGTFSEPKVQKSRDGAEIVRLYFLEKKTLSEPEPFAKIADQLRSDLVNKRLQKEQEAYFTRLRRHFNMDVDQLARDLPAHFEPYAIQ